MPVSVGLLQEDDVVTVGQLEKEAVLVGGLHLIVTTQSFGVP